MRALEHEVITLIATKLGVSEQTVLGTTSLERDYGADSVDLVELLTLLEDEFQIEIPDQEAEGFATVRQVVDYVEAVIEARDPRAKVVAPSASMNVGGVP